MIRMVADKVDTFFPQPKSWVGRISWADGTSLETDDPLYGYPSRRDFYIMDDGRGLVISKTLDVLEGYIGEEDVLLEEGIAARILPKGSFNICRFVGGFGAQRGHLLQSVIDGSPRVIRTDEMIICLDGGVINTSTL